MIILGLFLDSREFYYINSFDEVALTPSNSIVFQKFNIDNIELYKSLKSNSVDFALVVSDLLEAVLSNTLGAKYIIVNKRISTATQKCADNYMFDSRVLVEIKNKLEIEQHIINEIDGVVLESFLYKNK